MDFVEANLQLILQGVVVLIGVIFALRGFYKDGTEEDAPIRYRKKQFSKALLGTAIAFTLVSAFAFVPAGHRGVVFDRSEGVLAAERGEGVSLVIPYWQRVTNVSVRTQEITVESFIQTKDLQEVTLPVTVNFRIEADRAAEVYQNVGLDYQAIVIDPAVFQSTTASAGQYVAEDIAQSRVEIARAVQDSVGARLAEHGIIVEFVSIRDAVFDVEFLAAVKAKIIAEQKAEESLRLVEVARNEAEQARQTAQGSADAQAIVGVGQGEAISAIAKALGFTPEEYLTWLRLNTWDGVLPTTVLGSDDTTSVIIDLP